MANKKNLSRDEVLGGLGGRATKQAHTVLALIESRTAHLVAQSQQATNAALAVAATQTTPRAYLAAIAQGRAELPRPTIQEIERYAEHWAMLVPETPTIRATLAHLLGQNYDLPTQSAPAIRTALGLDADAVQQAYQRLYQQPITTVFAQKVTWWEGLRWRWSAFSSRLEALPPFWLTFFLTMPGASGLLALPIALANVGPLWGVVLILCFGVVNLLTVAALAETVVRSGTARFGLGFLGQLTQEYLGSAMSILLTVAMMVNNFVVLIIFLLGVAGTLAGATGLPATLWMLIPFAITLYFLSQRSLKATVTTNLLIVFVNLLILLALPLLALSHFKISNLMSGGGDQNFSPAALGLIVGILSSTFLSHFLVATYGPVVLPRDPSGRAWLRGSMAAIGVLMLIACLWLLVLNGVLSPQVLRDATGTVITPLAELVGPLVSLLGALLVILSLGLTTIQVALAQYYSVEERLPMRGSPSFVGKLSEQQRFLLSISPMFVILALAEWLAYSGVGSFAGLLGILGVLVLPLLIGIVPILLLVATRRKGDFAPGYLLHWLGHPLLMGLLYLFFIASILIHGLYIWQSWPLRLFAIGGGLVILVVSWLTWRQGIRTERAVIEICHDERLQGHSHCNLVANGQPLEADVTLHYGNRQEELHGTNLAISTFPALQSITLQVPTTTAVSLKIWVHHLPVEGGSLGLPARVTVWGDSPQPDFHGATSNGQFLVPWQGRAGRVEIVLVDSEK